MCRARVVLCVALVLYAPLQQAESTNGLKLPVHVSGWDYGEDVDHSRFWDLSTLLRAFTVANYEQMRPVMKKLSEGKPITVAAIGDSIVAGHAGCFHRDLEFLEQHLPFSDLTRLRKERCAVTNRKNAWLSSFMHLVNSTWPHPDHLVVNSGLPGMPFFGFARGACFEGFFPLQTDILILEHLPLLSSDMLAATMESLFIRLQLHFHGKMPAIIILNMHRALQGDHDRPDIEMCIKAASVEEDWCATNKTCHDTFLDLPNARTMIAPSELISHNLARYYGFTSLSHTGLINSMFRDDVHGRLKLSECQMFVKLFRDRVHPSDQGRLLMADLLTQYLSASEQYFAREAADPHPAPITQTALLPPSTPLYPDAEIIPRLRCYNMPAPSNGSAVKPDVAAVTLKEVKAERWQHYMTDPDNGALKPGWIAQEPGAVWQVQINTNFSGQGSSSSPDAQGDPGAQTKVIITYLLSHQHMGRAMVSCVSGCTCDPGVIDAHEAESQHSIPRLHQVRVSASPACVLQLKVLEQSSSGQHKFKVMQVAAEVDVDATDQLLALRHSALQAARKTYSSKAKP